MDKKHKKTEYMRKYRTKNREADRKYQKEYQREYYVKNLDKMREKAKYYGKKFRTESREKVFIVLGSVCCKCGFSDKRALQIDHINGGGSKDKRNGYSWYGDILKSIKNKECKYQLLCANCNWIKKYENKEVPKGRKPHLFISK